MNQILKSIPTLNLIQDDANEDDKAKYDEENDEDEWWKPIEPNISTVTISSSFQQVEWWERILVGEWDLK